MNFRSIKRIKKGVTALKKSQGELNNLCNSCALKTDCNDHKRLEAIRKLSGAHITLSTCPKFVFSLAFRDSKGLNQSCNTMRLGKAWSGRLKRNDVVFLTDTNDNKFAEAVVDDVLLIERDKALLDHGQSNHMLIEEKVSKQEAADRLAKILRNSYGTMIFKNSEFVTVIYLSPK